MSRRLTLQRFARMPNRTQDENLDHMYSINFDCASYYVKKNPRKALSYLNKCMEQSTDDSNVLHLRSICKRKIARIDSALEDALKARNFEPNNPGIDLEICDGLYEKNQFVTALMELHTDLRKYSGPIGEDFKDRIIVVNENLHDCLGDSLNQFLSRHIKILPEVVKSMERKNLIQKYPLWKIRKDNGECDVISIKQEQEVLLSPLELAHRKRWHRIFCQIYLGKSWKDEVFLRELLKNDKWMHPFTTLTPLLRDRIKSDFTIVNKFLRMLHARSPLYNEYFKKFGDQKYMKKHREQYLYKLQLQAHKKMFTAIKMLKQFRKLGKIEAMTKYTEDVMGDVVLKTSRVMPWKFEFIHEIYNIIGLAHADRYIISPTFVWEENPFNNLQRLLRVPKTQQSDATAYKFGDRSTFATPDLVDPKILKHKELISRLEKRVVFSKYPIEKCYLFYEMGRSYLKSNLYDESASMARRAMEESKKCNSHLWAFLSTMLVVKTHAFLQKIEYCYDALIDASNKAIPLKSPEILSFLELASSFTQDIIMLKRESSISTPRRTRSTRTTNTLSSQSTDGSSHTLCE